MTADLNIHLTNLATGKTNELTHWSSYEVIDDLMSPAATFRATLAAVQFQRDLTSTGGQKAQVFSYGALQATAIVDERSEAYNPGNTDLQISGRGVGGLLLDSVCPSDKLSMKNQTLKAVAERITEPWQPDFITSVVTNNAANRYMVAGVKPSYASKTKTRIEYRDANGEITSGPVVGGTQKEIQPRTKRMTKGTREKFGKNSPVYRGITNDSLNQTRITPQDKVWSVLSSLSQQIACHSFVGADGALIITRPSYDIDPGVYGDGIIQLWDKKRNKAAGGNVLRGQYETSIASRNSELAVWATGKAKKTAIGKANLKNNWSVRDPSPAFWKRTSTGALGDSILSKPDRMVFKNLRNEKLVRRACRSELEQRIIDSFSLEYQMAGHTLNGVLPVIDSMIPVHDERFGLTGQPYYITRVERKLDVSDGRTTVVKLIPPYIWLYLDHDAVGDSEYESHMVDKVFW
jgi:prophage tail gpP-like protein